MPVDWLVIAALVPVVLFSGLVHGALGLGFPMVATPIIAIFLDVKLAILLTLLPTAVVNIASIYSNDSLTATLKKYLLLALACLVGALVGAWVLSVSEASSYRLLLALLILLFLWIGKFGLLPRAWCLANPLTALILVGLIGGFSAGTTNVMVAVLLIYFLSIDAARSEMVSAMNLCFLLGKLAQIVVFYSAGLVSVAFIAATIPLGICAFGALKYGQHIGQQIPQERYRQMLHYLLAALAAILILQFLRDVM